MAKNETLTNLLLEFLFGKTDGKPKEAKHIFKLYLSLGNYDDATKTAVFVAREEQLAGKGRCLLELELIIKTLSSID